MGQNSKKKQKVHCKNTYSRKSTFLKGTFFRTKFLRILRLISHCSGSILKFSEKSPFQKSALPGIRVFTMDFFPRKFGEKKIFFRKKVDYKNRYSRKSTFLKVTFFRKKKFFFLRNFSEKSHFQKSALPGIPVFTIDFFPGNFFFSEISSNIPENFSGKKSITKTGIPGRALF